MKFHGGDGTNVPVFDVSATIPDVGIIGSPIPATNGGAVSVDASQDLSITWTPISIGKIVSTLRGPDIARQPRDVDRVHV